MQLQALRMQPTLVDALRGYWYTEDPDRPPPPPPPWMDWAFWGITRLPFASVRTKVALRHRLLLFHYRRHPEDVRVHFMLAAHAALLLRLNEAEERLQFAYEVMFGTDVRALARLALVWALKGEADCARDAVVRVGETPSFITGGEPSEEESAARAFDLISPFIGATGAVRRTRRQGAARRDRRRVSRGLRFRADVPRYGLGPGRLRRPARRNSVVTRPGPAWGLAG